VDAAANWKDRSPMVERIVRGTIRSEDEAERSRWRKYINGVARVVPEVRAAPGGTC